MKEKGLEKDNKAIMGTEEERKYDRLSKLYYEKYGKSYPMEEEDCRPLSFHNDRMRESILSGIEVPEEKYPDGVIH